MYHCFSIITHVIAAETDRDPQLKMFNCISFTFYASRYGEVMSLFLSPVLFWFRGIWFWLDLFGLPGEFIKGFL